MASSCRLLHLLPRPSLPLHPSPSSDSRPTLAPSHPWLHLDRSPVCFCACCQGMIEPGHMLVEVDGRPCGCGTRHDPTMHTHTKHTKHTLSTRTHYAHTHERWAVGLWRALFAGQRGCLEKYCSATV